MLYFVCENARDMGQPILFPLNEFTEENVRKIWVLTNKKM